MSRPTDNYTVVPTRVITHGDLSMEALGLYVHLLATAQHSGRPVIPYDQYTEHHSDARSELYIKNYIVLMDDGIDVR